MEDTVAQDARKTNLVINRYPGESVFLGGVKLAVRRVGFDDADLEVSWSESGELRRHGVTKIVGGTLDLLHLDATVQVVRIRGRAVRLKITAPPAVTVLREEIADRRSA